MKIAFLIASEKNSYHGIVRPFINWANALGERAILVFYRCPGMLRGMGDLNILKSTVISTDDQRELVGILNRNSVDYLISDDYPPRVRLLLKLTEKPKIRKAVYAQILYGMHALVQNFSKDTLDLKSKLMFSILPLIPFRLLSKIYYNLLKKVDTLMANSHFTASLLRCFYGLEVSGVVYPPINEMIFRPYPKKDVANGVTLYCGSSAGDTHPMLLKQLLELLINSNCVDKINMFGNNATHSLLDKLVNNSKVNTIQGMSDTGLARIYSESILTIAPQEWETFGYVPIESILCGTPVLAFASQPFSELLQEKYPVHLVYGRAALLERLRKLLADIECLRSKQRHLRFQEGLLNYLSQAHSANRLLSILS